MHASRLILTCLLLLFLVPATAIGFQEPGHTGEIIVRYHDQPGAELHSMPPGRALGLRGGPGQMVRALRARNTMLVRPAHPAEFDALLETYRNDPTVDYAEPNYLVRLLDVPLPNDPSFESSGAPGTWWVCGQINDGRCLSTRETHPDTRVAFAWRAITDQGRTPGSHNISVAVIDSGIDMDHPDLAPNISDAARRFITCPAFDVTCEQDAKDDPLADTSGHGTHIAGVIGAVGDNSEGLAGINWSIELLPLKAFDGRTANIADIADAIEYAIEREVAIINASYGTTRRNETEFRAVKAAAEAGILVIASAGNSNQDNDGDNPLYPASHPLDNIISVAAIDRAGQLASYSNYGAATVHLAAPGGENGALDQGILSTFPPALQDEDEDLNHDDPGYKVMVGTSMATAMVSGAAALYLSEDPGADFRELRERIVQTAHPDPALDSRLIGPGRLDIEALLSRDLTALDPLRPTHLRASSDHGGVQLEWLDNSTINDFYEVQRRSAGEDQWETLDASLPSDTTTYLDAHVDFGNREYRVLAIRQGRDPECCSSAVLSFRLSSGGGSSCFIATAAYGSPLAEEIEVFRDFREQVLRPHAAGRWFIARYEQYSPPLAAFIAERPWLRATVRTLLRPLVAIARWLQ